MRLLTKVDFEKIIIGSSFYGGGGGGSSQEGYNLLKEMEKECPNPELPMYDISEMPDNANIVSTMVAALGSPVATKGKTFQEESVNAVKAMMEEAKFNGKELKYVYSGEQGGGNTMLPLYAAWKSNLPILNTDGNGRAVPELNTGLAPIHGIATSPVVLASEKGDTIVGRTEDPMDSKACERIARYMCQAYDQGIGFAAWMMTQKDHMNATAIGQMTHTINVGEIILNSKAPKVSQDLEEYFTKSNHKYKLITQGIITDLKVNSEGGFDTGITTIQCSQTEHKYTVVFQNENLFITGPKGETIATVPNIISMLHILPTGYTMPISNSETKIGQEVIIVAVSAHERWYDNQAGYGCWEETLVSAGYRQVGKAVNL